MRGIHGWLVAALAAVSGCGGSASSVAEPDLGPQRVLLVQVDGLSAPLLEAYLARPATRAPDRALHRWLGLGPSGVPPRFRRALAAPAALAPLPALGAVTAATVLTGQSPNEHGLRGPGEALLPAARTVFERLPAGADSVVVGDWSAARGAARALTPADDGARAKAAAKALREARLVAVRFEGLAQAQHARGPNAGPEALAALDRLLALALPDLPPGVLLVLVGGHGAAEAPSSPTTRPAADFARLLEAPLESVHAAGGVLRIDALTGQQAAKLDEVPFTGLVLLNADGAVLRWDPDLGDVRPLLELDTDNAPDLVERVAAATRPGEWLALANRAQGFDFAVDGRPLGSAFTGGASATESHVALLFAGAGVGESLGRDLGDADLSAVAPTLLAVLGGDATGLLGPNLLATLRAPVAAEATPAGSVATRHPARATVAAALRATQPALALWLETASPAARLCFTDSPDEACADAESGRGPDLARAPTPAPDAETAARMAAALGAQVAVLADRAVAPAPLVASLAGPAWVEAALGTEPAATVARVRAWSEALAALEGGLFPTARLHLAAAAGLGAPWEDWRRLFDRWALVQDPDETELKTLPRPEGGWPQQLDWQLGFEQKQNLTQAPPKPDLAALTPAQRSLYTAFENLRSLPDMVSFCAPDGLATTARALESMATFQAAGLNGHAAVASAIAASALGQRPEVGAARARTLALLALPGAEWAVVGATSRMLAQAGIARLTGQSVPDDHLLQAQRLWLLALQRRIAADDAKGAADRNILRVSSLLFNTVDSGDPLLRETLALALGPDRSNAGALMGSLFTQGALAGVLGGQSLPRLAAALELMRQTLGPWLDAAAADLTPEQRLAKAVLPLTEALGALLTGNMPGLADRLAAAEALLSPQMALDLRDATRDAEVSAGPWAPAMLGTIYAGQAAQSGLGGDLPAARAKVAQLLDLAEGVAARELKHHGRAADLGPKVTAIAAVIRATVDLAFDTAQAPASAEGQTATGNPELVRKIAAALKTLDLTVPPAGDQEARILGLVAVAAHDAAWLLAQIDAPAGQAVDTAGLDAATATLAGIVAHWKPEGPLARGALLLALAAQRSLPAAPRLFGEGDDTHWATQLGQLKAVVDAFGALKADIDTAWPLASRTEAITAQGDLMALVVDLTRAILDADVLKLAQAQRLDGLVQGLDQRAGVLLDGISAQSGNAAAPVLALLRGWLGEYQAQPDAAASFAELAARRTADTDLFAGRWLLEAHAARWRRMGNDPAGAVSALDRAVAACPGARPHLDQLRAHLLIDRAAASALLDASHAEVARRGLGPARFTLPVVAADGDTEVRVNLELDLRGLLLGGTGGSFQLGAGWNSNDDDRDPVGARLELAGDGSSLEFVVESLLLQAWDDLRANETARADRSLTRLADAIFHQPDAGWFGTPAGPSASGRPQGLRLRSATNLLWVASLAHAQGFVGVSERLFGALMELLPEDLSSPPEGRFDRCPEGKIPALEALPEDKRLARETVCNLPKGLFRSLPEEAALLMADLGHWHARRLEGLKPDDASLQALLKRGVRHGLVPAWRAGDGKKPAAFADLDRALAPLVSVAGGPPKPLAKPQLQAIARTLEGPLRCQSLWPLVTQVNQVGEPVAAAAEQCSPGHARLTRMDLLTAPDALARLTDLAALVATTRRMPDGAFAAVAGRVLELAAQSEPTLAEAQTTRLAQVLDTVGAADAAFELKAMAVAARLRSQAPLGDLADLLREATIHRRGSPAARHLVKVAAFRPGEAAALAARFYLPQ